MFVVNELIDFIDGDEQITNPEIKVQLTQDDSFMDCNGTICEDFSIRLKLRKMVAETLKKK